MGSSDQVDTGQIIILFDGVCNLCNGAVQFIIKRDKYNKFLFAPLQSSFAQHQLTGIGYDVALPNSIVLIKNGQFFFRSNAALEIARYLSGGWPLLYGLKIFPRFLRDYVYNIIANKRYKIFGKRDSCMIPTPELRAKFIA